VIDLKTRLLVLTVSAAIILAAGSAFAATPLYFFNHNDLPASGAVASWDGAAAIGAPTATTIGGVKWESNTYSPGTGFRVAAPSSAISVSGATIIAAAIRGSVAESTPWTSIVDIMYDKLTLGIKNDTGQIVVRRNTSVDNSTATIAVGQATVLSMTVQTDGSYEVWADGVSVLTGGANGSMTEWDPSRTEFKDEPNWVGSGVPGGNWDAWRAAMAAQYSIIDNSTWDTYWGSWWGTLTNDQRTPYWGHTDVVPAFKKFIDIGRNDPDGWTAFSGNIGDVKIFGSALSNGDRLAEVAGTTQAMGLGAPVPEPSSILALLSGFAGLAGFAIRRRK